MPAWFTAVGGRIVHVLLLMLWTRFRVVRFLDSGDLDDDLGGR
jgi:hypothetical protein